MESHICDLCSFIYASFHSASFFRNAYMLICFSFFFFLAWYYYLVWIYHTGFPCGSAGIKNLPAMRETWVRSLGWEDPLEEETATHSSILAWRIPWTIQSMGSQRVGHDWATFTFTLDIPQFVYPFSSGCTTGLFPLFPLCMMLLFMDQSCFKHTQLFISVCI